MKFPKGDFTPDLLDIILPALDDAQIKRYITEREHLILNALVASDTQELSNADIQK